MVRTEGCLGYNAALMQLKHREISIALGGQTPIL